MQDAALVGELDGFSNDLQVSSGATRRQRLTGNQFRQVRPIDVVHDKKMLALVNADFMDADDVRMIEPTGSGGFEAEALDEFGPSQCAEQKHLDGDQAVKA